MILNTGVMKCFPLKPNFLHKRGMRYLFLNIDGVLHPKEGPYNLQLTRNVTNIVTQFDLRVVISSDWRVGASMDSIVESLGALGEHVVSMTPIFYPNDIKSYRWLAGASTLRGPRQLEIEEWLFQHTPGDSDWIALDCNPGHFIDGCRHVYFTDGQKGLNNEEVVAFETWCRKRLLKHVAA